jgi:lysophospholipase L1-like esterase
METDSPSIIIPNQPFLPFVLMCSLVLSSCQQATDNNSPGSVSPSLPTLSVPWSDQNSIVCFGTSLTYGYGAGEKRSWGSNPVDTAGNYALVGDSSYPRFLKEALRINVMNKGYVSARASFGLSALKDSVLSKKPVLVLLEFGANEFLQGGGSSHKCDSVLSLLVLDIAQSGSKVVLLSFVNPDMTKFMAKRYWTTQDLTRAVEYYTS